MWGGGGGPFFLFFFFSFFVDETCKIVLSHGELCILLLIGRDQITGSGGVQKASVSAISPPSFIQLRLVHRPVLTPSLISYIHLSRSDKHCGRLGDTVCLKYRPFFCLSPFFLFLTRVGRQHKVQIMLTACSWKLANFNYQGCRNDRVS